MRPGRRRSRQARCSPSPASPSRCAARTASATVVSDLSFTLARGETLCIAGESGSGKSMTALAIMRLLPQPAARISPAARIRLGDIDLAALGESRMRRIRGDRIAMIFQEPMTSLNPVLSIGRQLIEAIEAHTGLSRGEARAARHRGAAGGAHLRGREPAEAVSARALRRHAPARDDRHGAGAEARRADRRRADDGARRHRAGRGAGAAARPAARAGHRHHPDHPRHGRGRRDGRPRHRHARRPHGRARQGRRHLRDARRPTIRASCSPPCRASAPAPGAQRLAALPADTASRRRSPWSATSPSASTCAAASSAG